MRLPTRRRVNPNAHPEFSEAVTVSRFWRMVRVGHADDCWMWLGDTDGDGYGVFTYHGARKPAHELALSFSVGEKRLPGLDTCHSCDNPPCVNPAHLRFGTRASNVRDMLERGGHDRGKKLTAADVVRLRERRAMGARQKDLADEFGITNGSVSMIVRGLHWRHAGGPIQPERNSA